MSQIPLIDYTKHPAYKLFSVPSSFDDGEILGLVRQIDEKYNQLLEGSSKESVLLAQRFGQELAPGLDQLRRLVLGSGRLREGFLPYVNASISRAAVHLLMQIEFHQWRAIHPFPRAGESGTGVNLDKMRQDGFFKFEPDPELALEVWRRTSYERSNCLGKVKEKPWGRTAISLHPSSKASTLIKAKLERSGALDLASAYMGCRMEWNYCALEVSHDSQRWYRDCYADAGLPTAQTVYMHLDADAEMLKGMLYLKDVTLAQGPFRFVKGSHAWSRSPFLLALHKAFDMEEAAVFEMEQDKLDYKMGYYRPRFKDKESRRDFLSLPTLFRGTTHFGDDIMDGSDLSKYLLEPETVFVGPAGTYLLFDGSAGIHRGGLVQSGERWAIQIGLKATRENRAAIGSVLSSWVNGLRYRAHVAKRSVKRLFLAK